MTSGKRGRFSIFFAIQELFSVFFVDLPISHILKAKLLLVKNISSIADIHKLGLLPICSHKVRNVRSWLREWINNMGQSNFQHNVNALFVNSKICWRIYKKLLNDFFKLYFTVHNKPFKVLNFAASVSSLLYGNRAKMASM